MILWPILVVLLLALLAGAHFWWRARLAAVEVDARRELERLKQSHQERMLQVQHQQEALFDSMAEGLLLLDQDGRIHLANRAFNQLFGVSRHIRSQTIIEALRLHELAELVDFLGKQKQVLGHELKLSRPNERWLQINGAALFNGNGKRTGTVLVFHDLTRLKQLEGTRQEFVANVSHELRTPLSLIKGYVETLLDGAREQPDLALKFLRTIDRNAERLKLLIEDLLTISELESGRVKLHLQSVAVRDVTDKVLADFKARAEARKVKLVDATQDLRVRADPDRLEQVLGNLVDNAIKYGRNEGTVTIRAQAVDSGQVELAVADDGPGIPPEALERVFERFYRVDKARSREQGGTGLGLSIVKHIVQTHGGKAWARSKPGEGATFLFTLPRDPGGLQQPLL
ncbi:MAG TPA: ATP-binding protein [Verrucomicrobiae bacterium]|nr:ATP-binding protein [Verrucomicrobiae bacterium]